MTCGSDTRLSYIIFATSSTAKSLSFIEMSPSLETQICAVWRLPFNFSIFSAFGIFTGRPEYSRRTVVTMKNINNIKMISGIDEVGISLEIFVLRENFINLN